MKMVIFGGIRAICRSPKKRRMFYIRLRPLGMQGIDKAHCILVAKFLEKLFS